MSESKIRKKLISFKNANKRKKKYESISFSKKGTSQKRKSANKRVKVIRNRIVTAVCILAVIVFASYLLLFMLHPIGVFEYIGYNIKTSGNGEGYDIDIFGGKPLSVTNEDRVFYAVTDRSLNCYNIQGKTVFEKIHSFKRPVLKTAETRYLMYGQGEPDILIGNLSNTLYTTSFEQGIICAYINDSGYYAIATKSNGYESSISVFNKKNKKIYEWFLSDEIVNGICLSPNGKTLAVSTVKVLKGLSISSVHILKYDSASPIMSKTYNDEYVYGIKATSNKVFCAIFDNSLEFINHNKKTSVVNETEYSVSMIKQFGSRLVAIRTVAANQDDSIVEVYNKKGEIISAFNVESYISDVSYKSGKIYLLGHSKAYKYNINGKPLAFVDVGYDTSYIEVISDNRIACIRNSTIEKQELVKMVD